MKKRKEFTPAKRKKIRRKIILYAGAVCAGMVVAGGVYAVIFSDIPKVQAVEVRGNRLVPGEEIKEKAAEEIARESWWRGALGENHVLFWRSGETKKMVQELPKLKTAKISRNMWKRTITIWVEEKEAKGIWCAAPLDGQSPEGRCFAFNEDGILFAEAPEARGYLIMKITGEKGVPIGVGDRVLGNAEWFQNIRRTIEGVEASGIEVRAVEVESRERKEWSIVTSDGKNLLFDFTRVPDRLSAVLENLREARGAGAGQVFDFRVPEKVYVR